MLRARRENCRSHHIIDGLFWHVSAAGKPLTALILLANRAGPGQRTGAGAHGAQAGEDGGDV